MVTQPSVSAAVSALERELGVRLTERAGRTLRPTAAGAAYAPYASDVLGLLEQGARAAREARGGAPHTLRISAVTTAGEYLVPQLIQAFRERRPELEISLDVGQPRGGVPARAGPQGGRGRDGSHPGRRTARGDDFADHEFVLVTAPGDPFARRPLGGGRGARGEALAAPRAGLGHAHPVEEFLAPRASSRPSSRSARTARSSRRREPASGWRSSHGWRWSSSSSWASSRRSRRAAGCRSGAGTWCEARSAPCAKDVEAFMAFCGSPAARHALAGQAR